MYKKEDKMSEERDAAAAAQNLAVESPQQQPAAAAQNLAVESPQQQPAAAAQISDKEVNTIVDKVVPAVQKKLQETSAAVKSNTEGDGKGADADNAAKIAELEEIITNTSITEEERNNAQAELDKLKPTDAVQGGRRRSKRKQHKKSGKKSRRQSKKGGKKHAKSAKKGKKRSHRKH